MFGASLGQGLSNGILEAFRRKREDEVLARKQQFKASAMDQEYALRAKNEAAAREDNNRADMEQVIARLQMAQSFKMQEQARQEREQIDTAFYEIDPASLSPPALSEYNAIVGEEMSFYQSPQMGLGLVPQAIQQKFSQSAYDRKKKLLQRIKPKSPQEQFQAETFTAPNGAIYGKDRSGAWREVTPAPKPQENAPTTAGNHPAWRAYVSENPQYASWPVSADGKPLIPFPKEGDQANLPPNQDPEAMSKFRKMAADEWKAENGNDIPAPAGWIEQRANAIADSMSQVGERSSERRAVETLMRNDPDNAPAIQFLYQQVVDQSRQRQIPPEVLIEREIRETMSQPGSNANPDIVRRVQLLNRIKKELDAIK